MLYNSSTTCASAEYSHTLLIPLSVFDPGFPSCPQVPQQQAVGARRIMVLDKAPAPGGKSSDGDAAAGASPAIKMFAGFSSTDDKARDSSLASAGPPTGAAIEVCPMGNLGSKSTPAAVLGIIWVTRILAVVLLAVGAAQWAYASDLQSKVSTGTQV